MADIENKEKGRIYCRHGIDHCLDVARIGYIFALEKGIDISKELIYSAALLHDIGRSVQKEDHDIIGAEIAEDILKECSFSTGDISLIVSAIKEHRNDTDDREDLSGIIRRADKLSRACYSCKAYNSCYWSEERKNKEVIV